MPVAAVSAGPKLIVPRLCLIASATAVARRRELMPGISRSRSLIWARGDPAIFLRLSELLGRRRRPLRIRPLIARRAISAEAAPVGAVLAWLNIWPNSASTVGLISRIPLSRLAEGAAVVMSILHARIFNHALLSRCLLAKRPLPDGGATLREEVLRVCVRSAGDLR